MWTCVPASVCQLLYCTALVLKVLYYKVKNVSFIFLICLFSMYYLCEKYYKPITVQYYIVHCVSWVPRLTLLDLRTHWTQEYALRTKIGDLLWSFEQSSRLPPIQLVLEKTFESPLGCKEIKPVNPKGSQPVIFIGRTEAETEAPVLQSPNVKSWLIGKDSDVGKDRRQEEKGMTEDEMVGWHHQLDGHEFEQAPGDSDGQGSLACCSPWGRKEPDTT